MAPNRSGCLGLLLLTCCLTAAQVDLLSLNWLWSTRTAGPTADLVSVSRSSPSLQPTENTTTHVASRDAPTNPGTAPANPEPPLERLEADQDRASTAPLASTTSQDTKEENIAGVGAKILTVAQGIRSFVRLWDNATPTDSTTRAKMPDSATPTDPLALPEPSGPPQENTAALWLGSGVHSSPDSQGTAASTPPGAPQPPSSAGGPQAWLREPTVPPPPPGRASLSSVPGGTPSWEGQSSLGQLQDSDSKGLSSVAHPGRQHGYRRGTPQPLPLVAGLLGARAGPSALSPDTPSELSHIPLSALIGDSGAWSPYAANSVGPALVNDSVLLRADPLASAGQPPTGRCLPLPPSLPICGHLGIGRSWLPNHLRHASGEEVQAAAQAWGSLLRTHCHRFLAWFFCLLLAPPCPPPGPPPCRQFCEALEDACWSQLAGGGLPVPCASLPALEDGHCVFIGPAAGNCPPLPPFALSLAQVPTLAQVP